LERRKRDDNSTGYDQVSGNVWKPNGSTHNELHVQILCRIRKSFLYTCNFGWIAKKNTTCPPETLPSTQAPQNDLHVADWSARRENAQDRQQHRSVGTRAPCFQSSHAYGVQTTRVCWCFGNGYPTSRKAPPGIRIIKIIRLIHVECGLYLYRSLIFDSIRFFFRFALL